MFKYKFNEKTTEDVKELVSEMFEFKIVLFFEFIGFALVLSFITEKLIMPNVGFLFVFFPFLLFVYLLYWTTHHFKLKK